MSLENARRFVSQMREDHDFRKMTLATTRTEDLSSFLHSEGLIFDQRELIGAMAECMEQLELQMAS